MNLTLNRTYRRFLTLVRSVLRLCVPALLAISVLTVVAAAPANARTPKIKKPGAPTAVHVWVTNAGPQPPTLTPGDTVTELNASDGSGVATIQVGNSPTGISSDGSHVWVANYGSNTVTELAL
jgi:hypothetical protein